MMFSLVKLHIQEMETFKGNLKLKVFNCTHFRFCPLLVSGLNVHFITKITQSVDDLTFNTNNSFRIYNFV